MNQILNPGQTVHTESSGMPCEVEQFLGGGGQGEVYRSDLGGKPVALKWYFPAYLQATPGQRAALETLIKKGAPSDKFLWPMELTSEEGVEGFGYIMPLREPRYKSLFDLMKRRIEPSFRALATAGHELSHSFLLLHAKGLCYRDISFGNVFFEPNTGNVLICDNDNVAVDGEAQVVGVLGTPRFMAPEIVRNEALPSTQTDLFSLAVLLFYMFVVHHPLEGKKESSIHCLDLPSMNKLYGEEPLFIYDTNDDSNRPDPDYHENAIVFWNIYPKFLKDLFTQAFTDGISDPQNGRVRESEWRGAMVKLRDSIIYCGCGMENFYDVEDLKASGGKPSPCWKCQNELRLPPRIRIERNIVMLNHDTQLFPHHVDSQKMYDFSKPVAEVTQHPRDPSIWGIKNLSDEKWVSTTADGDIKDVESGRSVTMAVGTKINFGKTEGEIRV